MDGPVAQRKCDAKKANLAVIQIDLRGQRASQTVSYVLISLVSTMSPYRAV